MNINKRKEKFEKVDDFLDKLFHLKTRTNAYYYKLSNAVSQCFIADITNKYGDIFKQHGLIYSSIIRNKKSFNIVLKPIYLNHYKIDFIQTFKISKKSKDMLKIQLMRQGFLNGIKKLSSENYDIVWKDFSDKSDTIRKYKL